MIQFMRENHSCIEIGEVYWITFFCLEQTYRLGVNKNNIKWKIGLLICQQIFIFIESFFFCILDSMKSINFNEILHQLFIIIDSRRNISWLHSTQTYFYRFSQYSEYWILLNNNIRLFHLFYFMNFLCLFFIWSIILIRSLQ